MAVKTALLVALFFTLGCQRSQHKTTRADLLQTNMVEAQKILEAATAALPTQRIERAMARAIIPPSPRETILPFRTSGIPVPRQIWTVQASTNMLNWFHYCDNTNDTITVHASEAAQMFFRVKGEPLFQ